MVERAPATMAEFVDPMKELFTWKWVFAVFITLCALFTEFTFFLITILTGNFIWTVIIILSFVATLVLFIIYALTPGKLEENVSRIMFEGRVKHGIDTFAKHSPTVKKWVVRNFTGFVEIDEETGLCKEKERGRFDL
jgi:hypothetical protein